MGVVGLLPKLKSVMDQVNVAKYKGKTVGIDACGWLYKGCYSCAADLVQRKDTDAYLNFSIQQIKFLQEQGVRPLFVFDGAPLPAKADLNEERYRIRQIWQQKARQSAQEGGEGDTGTPAFNKAVSVSNAMIMKLIGVLRRMGIQFIVAPYEADAQLAYLSKIKIVDAVISEDSDCIPYGCRTVLFKWNADGWASEFRRRSLGANDELSFVEWTEEMFVQLCVLCGCDYCPSVRGVGIVTAYNLVNAHKKPVEVLSALIELKGDHVPPDFPEKFYTAVLTFRHHLVFDPRDEKLKMLNPLSVSGDLLQFVNNDLKFLGDLELNDAVAASIARGSIHPATHESYAWKETAELQSLASADEDGLKSMTSSETSSNVGTSLGHNPESDQLEFKERYGGAVFVGDGECSHLSRQSVELGPKKPPISSWRHLDGVLGTSQHILNFRSPKVSENFRPLVATDSQRPHFHAGKTAEQMKVYEDIPCRQSLKRVRNPRYRKREDQKSGFDGEVTCRVDSNDGESQHLSQRRRLSKESATEVLGGPSQNLASYPTVATATESQDHVKPPFFACNRQFSRLAPSVTENFSASLPGSDQESKIVWSLGREGKTIGSAFNGVAAKRAVSAEEKWDRILAADVVSSDEDASSPNVRIESSLEISR